MVFPGAFQDGADPAEDAVGVTTAPLVGAIPDIEDSLKTPYRPDVACETQEQPNLDASSLDLSGFNSTSGAALPRPAGLTEGLRSAVESANGENDAITELFAAGRTAKGQDLRTDVLDNVNAELAKVYDMEYLIDLFDEEPTP